MKFHYVCTNYNNSHFTVRAVETLNGGAMPPDRIIVVDNASQSGELAQLHDLAARFANVTIVANSENTGYFRGLNAGLALVADSIDEGDGIVIGNNDLEFPGDFGTGLSRALAEAAKTGRRPVISPYIETLDGHPQNPHVTSGVSRVRELVYDCYYSNFTIARVIRKLAAATERFSRRSDESGHARPGYIYQGHGSCYVLTRTFIDRCGELWAPTFLMGEEYFLSRQLAQLGFMVYYDPRIRIKHRCNGSIGNEPGKKMWRIAAESHAIYREFVKPWHRQDWSDMSRRLDERDRLMQNK